MRPLSLTFRELAERRRDERSDLLSPKAVVYACKLPNRCERYLASKNDPLTRTTSLSYNAGGLLTKLVDPRRGVHTMCDDATGLFAKDAGPAGASWSFSRKEDASGYAVTVAMTAGVQRTHQGAAAVPGVEARPVKHADSTTTSWTKQDADRETGSLASITAATSRKTLYQRDAAARPTMVTGPDGAKLSMRFDAHDNLTSVTPPGKSAHAFVYTPDDVEATYTPPKSPVTTTFGGDRRPLVTTRPDASTWPRGYDAAGRLSSFAYQG